MTNRELVLAVTIMVTSTIVAIALIANFIFISLCEIA